MVSSFLTTLKSQIEARLLEITASPKPSYSIDGQSFSYNEYFTTLMEQLAKTKEAIAQEDPLFEIDQII